MELSRVPKLKTRTQALITQEKFPVRTRDISFRVDMLTSACTLVSCLCVCMCVWKGKRAGCAQRGVTRVVVPFLARSVTIRI